LKRKKLLFSVRTKLRNLRQPSREKEIDDITKAYSNLRHTIAPELSQYNEVPSYTKPVTLDNLAICIWSPPEKPQQGEIYRYTNHEVAVDSDLWHVPIFELPKDKIIVYPSQADAKEYLAELKK
jgi:hypothetical protein